MDWKSEVLKVYPDTEIVLIKRTGKYFATSKNGTSGVGGRLSEYCDTEAQTWESAYQRLPKRDGAEGGTAQGSGDCLCSSRTCHLNHPHRNQFIAPPAPSVVAGSGPRPQTKVVMELSPAPLGSIGELYWAFTIYAKGEVVGVGSAGMFDECSSMAEELLTDLSVIAVKADTAAVAKCPKCHEEHTGDCDPRDSPERIAELVAVAEREKGEDSRPEEGCCAIISYCEEPQSNPEIEGQKDVLPGLPTDAELVNIIKEIFPDDPGFLRTSWKDGIDLEVPTVKCCEFVLRITKPIRDQFLAHIRSTREEIQHLCESIIELKKTAESQHQQDTEKMKQAVEVLKELQNWSKVPVISMAISILSPDTEGGGK